jgi:hypothetical protein
METIFEQNYKLTAMVLAYRKRQDKLDKEIGELKAKRDRMRYPEMEKVFAPIFDAMAKKLKAERYDVLGPFGLSSEYGIHFYPAGTDDVNKLVGSLNLIRYGEGFALRNHRENEHSFLPGTIGQMAGMNHPTVKFTKDMDIQWLVDFAKKN